jgi:hypothetical protein
MISGFFETVSFNEGQLLRVFKDPDEALQWMAGQARGS